MHAVLSPKKWTTVLFFFFCREEKLRTYLKRLSFVFGRFYDVVGAPICFRFNLTFSQQQNKDSLRGLFLNIPNSLADWVDGPNRLLSILVFFGRTKRQTKSKCFFQADVSSKKKNELILLYYYDTWSRIVFVRFFGRIEHTFWN